MCSLPARRRSSRLLAPPSHKPRLVAAGNTVVPAILALEALGFTLSRPPAGAGSGVWATRGEETFIAEDPVTVLGLVRLVELRGWDWRAPDAEIERVLAQYPGL